MNIIAMVVVQKGNVSHTVQELLKDDHNERNPTGQCLTVCKIERKALGKCMTNKWQEVQ